MIRWLLFPLRVLAELCVIIFDMMLSRYLLAAAIVGVIWLPIYLLFGASHGWFIWPSVVLGMAFCGLWDGCQIFTIRDYVAKTGLVRSWSDVNS